MPTELVGVIIGGAIGIIGSLGTTLLVVLLSNRRRAQAIRVIAKGEITAIKEKAQRYIDGQSTAEELGASTPMLASIATELGFLSEEEAVALRRTVTLDMEMRKKGSKEKALSAVKACADALRVLSGEEAKETI